MPTATPTRKGRITVAVAVQNSSAAGLKGRFAGRVTQAVSIEAMDKAVVEQEAQHMGAPALSA